MPFDSTHAAIYGADAKQPELWARTTLCDWLKGVLNDPAKPYAATLGLRLAGPFTAGQPERRAIVTDNRKIARTMSAAKSAPPVVFAHRVMLGDWMPNRAHIGAAWFEGKRYNEVTIYLDMGVSDATPSQIDVVHEERDGDLLGAFVRDAVRVGYDEINALGLFNPELRQDEKGAGQNPHVFNCFLKTLENWTP